MVKTKNEKDYSVAYIAIGLGIGIMLSNSIVNPIEVGFLNLIIGIIYIYIQSRK